MAHKSPTIEAIKMGLVMFALFCGVRLYMLIANVIIFKIPVLDPILLKAVKWLKGGQIEVYLDGLTKFFQNF